MRKLRPAEELNQSNLTLLGPGCILVPAAPYNPRGNEALPAQEDLWYCALGSHSGQQSPPQAEASASRDAGGCR